MKPMTLAARGLLPLLALGSPAFAWEPIVSLAGEHLTIHPAGATDEILATREQTGGQFSVITLGGAAGTGPGPAIVNSLAAEAWYVLEGTFEFHVDDRTVEGGPGTFVAFEAGQPHGYIAQTEGKLLVIYTPGGYEHFFMDWDATPGLVPGPELGPLEESYGVTRP